MIHINLMPREERVRRRAMPAIKLPDFGAVLPLAGLGLVIGSIVMVSTLQKREVVRLESEIALMRQESESYKPQLEKIREITQKRQEVGNRLDIIARLDQERYFRVRLMDEISKSVPENVWITKVQETSPHQFAIEGVTFSNFLVARLMEDLEATPHWQKVELGVAQQGNIEGTDVVQFNLVSGAQP